MLPKLIKYTTKCLNCYDMYLALSCCRFLLCSMVVSVWFTNEYKFHHLCIWISGDQLNIFFCLWPLNYSFVDALICDYPESLHHKSCDISSCSSHVISRYSKTMLNPVDTHPKMHEIGPYIHAHHSLLSARELAQHPSVCVCEIMLKESAHWSG